MKQESKKGEAGFKIGLAEIVSCPVPDVPPSCVGYLRENVPVADELATSRLQELVPIKDHCAERLKILLPLVTALQKARDDAERRIAEYSSARSPIRKLPAEVILEIFRHYCHPIYALMTRREFTDELAFLRRRPFVLSCVCSFWRSLSLNEPCLWTTIAISNPREGSFDRYKVMIDRCRSDPLLVHIRDTSEVGIGFFMPLLEHSYRFKLFHVYGMTGRCDVAFPNLKSLGHQSYEDDDYYTLDLTDFVGAYLENLQLNIRGDVSIHPHWINRKILNLAVDGTPYFCLFSMNMTPDINSAKLFVNDGFVGVWTAPLQFGSLTDLTIVLGVDKGSPADDTWEPSPDAVAMPSPRQDRHREIQPGPDVMGIENAPVVWPAQWRMVDPGCSFVTEYATPVHGEAEMRFHGRFLNDAYPSEDEAVMTDNSSIESDWPHDDASDVSGDWTYPDASQGDQYPLNEMFMVLEFPSLQSLIIEVTDDNPHPAQWPHQSFINLIYKPTGGISLRRLHLSDITIAEEEIHNLFELLPTLEDVLLSPRTLRPFPLTPNLVSSLARSRSAGDNPSPHGLLPKLRNLSLWLWNHSPEAITEMLDALTHVVQSRHPQTAKFKQLKEIHFLSHTQLYGKEATEAYYRFRMVLSECGVAMDGRLQIAG